MEKLHYRECRTGRRFILKLEPGSNLTLALLEFARTEAIQFISLVSAVGSIRDVEFSGIQAGAHLPMTGPRVKTHRLEGPLELMGLEGNIAPNPKKGLDAQLYVIASKSNGEVVGGRLVAATVFATCEIVLAEYLVDGVERQFSATGGVDTLFIQEKGAPS